MRKTFFTLIALLLSLTTVNAQMLTPDGSITVTRQHTAVINKHMAPAMGSQPHSDGRRRENNGLLRL